jgi:hypothetical protein
MMKSQKSQTTRSETMPPHSHRLETVVRDTRVSGTDQGYASETVHHLRAPDDPNPSRPVEKGKQGGSRLF